jgi:hypothetical protein
LKIHRRFAVFGSRILFIALAPWLIICIPLFPYMAANFAKGTRELVLAWLLSALCFAGILAAIDSWRFLRIIIAFLYLVPIAYCAYLLHTYIFLGMAFEPSFRVSEAKPFSAFVGLIIWGLPCVLGARQLTRKLQRVRAIEAKWRARKTG